MNEGASCSNGKTYGRCDDKGFCVIEDKKKKIKSDPTEECPPGLIYYGPNSNSCYIECDYPNADSILGHKTFRRKDGVECFEANRYGQCDDGMCVIDQDDPRNKDSMGQGGRQP
jgi:hypothetical protein